MEPVDPKSNFAFRKLFASEENKDLLMSLINSIVSPRIVITDLRILDPYNLADYVGGKETILDIKAVDLYGNWYNVEMQLVGAAVYAARAVYYSAKLLTDQIPEGGDYSLITTSTGIHFLNFTLFRDLRCKRHVVLKDEESNEYYEQLSCLQLHFVEMNKFHSAA